MKIRWANRSKLASEFRAEGLRVLVYPEADKLGKQFKYADSLNIPFVCVLGETELAENKVTLKNLKTGEQETVSREEIVGKLKKWNPRNSDETLKCRIFSSTVK